MSSKKKPFPEVIRSGEHSVSIYFCKAHNGRASRFMLADYTSGKRVCRYFSTVEAARDEARRICKLLVAGDKEGAAMTGKDRAELVRSRALVSRHGVTVEQACAIFAVAADLVGAKGVVPAINATVKRKAKPHSRQ